jgi:O-antigen/teichoic acid export membrane protein
MFLYLLGGHMLYALGRQRYVTKAMLLVGLVNVTLNLIVIPRWSYLGASGVALGSELLLFGLLYIPARRALGACKADEAGERDAVALP